MFFPLYQKNCINIILLSLAESSKGATQRICKELRTIINKQSEPSNDLGFFVDTNKLRSVYQWVYNLYLELVI